MQCFAWGPQVHLTRCLRTLRARLLRSFSATLWPRAARAKGPGQGKTPGVVIEKRREEPRSPVKNAARDGCIKVKNSFTIRTKRYSSHFT